MTHRFLGIQTKPTEEGGEFSSYVRTYVYDAELNEYASFDSGDPVADFASATDFCAKSGYDGTYVISSSIDDLVFDVPGYRFDPDAGEYGAVVVDENDDRLTSGTATAKPADPRP